MMLDCYHPDLSDDEVSFLRALDATPIAYLNNESVRNQYFEKKQNWTGYDVSWLYGD